MKERLSILKKVLIPIDKEYQAKSDLYYDWFVQDVIYLIKQNQLMNDEQINQLLVYANDEEIIIPEDWEQLFADLQAQSETMIANNRANDELYNKWTMLCVRCVLGYARNLIRQGTLSALFVRNNGKEALTKAIEPTIEFFSWNINRIFYQIGMPQTGFCDLCDITDMGRLGMMADQECLPAWDDKKDNITYKYTPLTTCQLFGFFDSTASFIGVPKGSTSDAYCRFCVGHGVTTMKFVCPPDRTLKYYLGEGLGYNEGKRCMFVLETMDGEDNERADEAMNKIFAEEVEEYQV